MLRADAGFSNGVSFYRESTELEEAGRESRFASSTFDAAIRWIAAHAEERFFLFLHTYVVHWPYEPPAEFDLFRTAEPVRAGSPLQTGDFEPMRRSYAGEVRYADALFGRLRGELSRLGLAPRTLVVVTSDHGEEFGEHGSWSHSRQLYDEVLHVPLIFWAPRNLGAPRRAPGLASLVDLMPTVLDVLDVPVPPGVEGRSLLDGTPATDRVIFADVELTGGRRVMARTGDAKWVWDYKDGRVVEAFDLRADPEERRSLDDAAFHARGAPYLADYLARADAAPAAPAASDAPADPATVEKLRALGYVQ
jgi:arylsulfatase A-like enzyme